MNKKLTKLPYLAFIFLFAITILLSPTITADHNIEKLGTFTEGNNISLLQTSANSTFVNFTGVFDPDGNTILSDVQADKDGTKYNYTLNGNETIDKVGTWLVTGIGNPDGEIKTFAYEFDVKRDTSGVFGIDLGETINIVLIVIMLLFSIPLFYFKMFAWSGFVMTLTGLTLLFNGFSVLIGMIITIVGILIVFLLNE